MIHDAPPLPSRKKRNLALPLLALLLVAGAGYWWWTNRPAHIAAITIWLPDGRPVVVPAASPEFDALVAAVKGIVSFTPSVARYAGGEGIGRGALFPSWEENPAAVCVVAQYDRALHRGGVSEDPGADRVVIGSRSHRLPEKDLTVAAGMWAIGAWLWLPLDYQRVEARAPALGKAVEDALEHWQPADALTVPAPANTEAVIASPTQSTLDPVPDEAWNGIAFHLAAPLARADTWETATTPTLSVGAVTLECRFKQPILLTDDAGGRWQMRAIHFAWLKDARHGVAWVETDRGIYRWRAAHIYKPLELYLYRAGTYGPGATAPHGGDL